VVVRYLELLPTEGDTLRYVYPMGSSDPVEIGEFSLAVDLGSDGQHTTIATLADAVVEEGGKRVTMRRSGFSPRTDFQLEAKLSKPGDALRVARFAPGEDRADYVMARYAPDVDWLALKETPADVVVVVDTSASGDDAARQKRRRWRRRSARAVARGALRAAGAGRDGATVLYPKEGLAEAKEADISTALDAPRGARERAARRTSGRFFDSALGRVHGKEQPAVVYIGDGWRPRARCAATELVERLRRSLSESRARFFTVGGRRSTRTTRCSAISPAWAAVSRFASTTPSGATAEVCAS
jgi:Ca-activated chloride channel family protein